MNACQTRDLRPEGVGHAAFLPLEEALRGQRELHSEDLREGVDQFAVVMRGVGHSPVYQHSVYISSPQSLIAVKTWLMQNALMSLSERITAAYNDLGISQAEAARRCGWSAQRFGQYASGRRTPDLNSLLKIAEVLNTTPDILLGVNEQAGSELIDILCRLLELEGLEPENARTIAEAASATQQVLKSLPDGSDDQDRARLAAQAVWSARRLPKPGTSLDR